MTDVKRQIDKFKFKNVRNAHVALVDAGANELEVLTMKSAPAQHDVQVTLPMKNFLKIFFDMWEEDAAVLAGIMGFEPKLYDDHIKDNGAMLTAEEMVQQKIDSVMLLKGKVIPDEAPEAVVSQIANLMKNFGDEITSKGSPSEDITDNGESKLDKVELTQEELDTMKSQIAEATKLAEALDTMKSQNASLQAILQENQKQEMVTCVKGYSFIAEDAQEAVVDSLLSLDDEQSAPILKALEAARDAITVGVDIDKETGSEGGDSTLSVEGTDLEKAAGGLVKQLIADRHA